MGVHMFTSDNSDYDSADRDVLNEALRRLLRGHSDDGEAGREIERSYQDRLNNAWHAYVTVDELIEAVRIQP